MTNVLMGELPDGTTGFRLEEQLLGVAQFSQFSDGTTALKVAKPGFEVSTATNSQLVFNSNQDIFKIVGTGTGVAPTVTTGADGTNTYSGFATNPYPHGLGFTPAIIAYYLQSANSYVLMPYSEVVSASAPQGGIISSIYRTTVDSNNVYIFHYVVTYSPGIGSGTYPGASVKYYLLQETAN